MNCKITIGYENDPSAGYVCFGSLKPEKDGFALEYDFDGDKCTLVYRGGALQQSRRGKMNTDIAFIAGRRTRCVTKDTELGYGCTLEVCTRSLNYKKTEKGFDLRLEYMLEDSHMLMNFTAEIVWEQ